MPTTGKFFQSEGREADVTRAITRAWADQFDQMIQSDVLVVGAGPSGLCCALNLARQGMRAVVVEQCNHLGGGFWNGGYLANKAAIRRPADRILEELRVPLQDHGGILLCDPPHATAALIAACYAAGVRFLNLTVVRDVIWRENRLDGLVVNWAPLYQMPYGTAHVDPIPLESSVVVDATGHDASVVHMLAKRNICAAPPGNGAMWIEESEEEVVKRTGEHVPNLWLCGLSVAAVNGTPRMGPAFGAMLLSGERAAEQITAKLRRPAMPSATQAYKAGAGSPMVQVKLPPAPTPVAPTRAFPAAPVAPAAAVGAARLAPGTPLPAPGTPPSGTRTPSGIQPAVAAQIPQPAGQSPSGGALPAVNAQGQPVSPSNPPSSQLKAPPPPDPGIPTVSPETNRWMRGSTSRFFKKKP
ncbi:MAG: thiazole biosynthesis protein [Planctomycetia bacterium]|nr:thiazole biosynthesis protein [Planctomycetia bacterium]